MIQEETIYRMNLLDQQQNPQPIEQNNNINNQSNGSIQRKESILESPDQDGMTCIDMALSSGYKALASRLAQWIYTDTRTMVNYMIRYLFVFC